MKKRMEQKLINLAIGESVAVAVFWIDFFMFKKLLPTVKALISVSFSLFILSFILVQASVFWWILLKRISRPKATGKIYAKFKILDVILLGIGIPLILLSSDKPFVVLISLFIWIFALIEWINYYKLQLSYSLNPIVLLKYILQKKLRKSKIAKEIDEAV